MPTVLIIDDSGFQRNVLKTSMARAGYDTIEAANGNEGLEKLESGTPDLVLTDITMPDMDGVEVLENLRKKEIKVPVVVVSADIQETTRKKCMDLGAVGFINKPVKGASLENLLNIIKCYINP